MNCDTFLNRYLLLDKHELLPVGLKLHFFCCKSCRHNVDRLNAAQNVQRHILAMPAAADDRRVRATMNAIYRVSEQAASAVVRREEHKTLLPWLAVGTFLIVGFILLPFSDIGEIGLRQFGDSFCISFALLCAGSVILYFAVFLAKNLVFFTEKLTRQI